MDKRLSYFCGVDTETCNGLAGVGDGMPIVYDIGWAIVDKRGNSYIERSFVVEDVFFGMVDSMNMAYYKNKIPAYIEDINAHRREVASLYHIRKVFAQDCKEYNVKAIFAYNTRFDLEALNNTLRYISKSKMRYFFPYGVELWDAMKMARQVIATQKGYINFCTAHKHVTKSGKARTSAEVMYRYITGAHDFKESHTGLEDVQIEAKIFAHCIRQHKRMEKRLFPNAQAPEPWPPILVWKQQKLNMAWG